MMRSRRISKELVDWVVGKRRILIVAHDNPDPDSLAAAFALRHLFLVKSGREATIAFGGIIGRGENRVMVEKLEIDAIPIESLDLDSFDVFCLVDTQPGAGNNSFPADRQVHVVVDHHPAREQTLQCRWADVRPEYGASATILFEYLLSQEVYLGTKLATILFYAIKSETQDLGREWSKADRDAYLHLLRLSNNRILYDITHPKAPRDYFLFFNKALENARLYERVLVFNLYDIGNPDMVSEMADFLLRMQGIEVTLGMGRFKKKVIVSMRTSNTEINAGEVIQRVLDGLGTAGGHGMIAGGQITPQEGNEAMLRELQLSLTQRLLKALEMPSIKGRKLIADS
ncbi:MAG: phosphoesterase [Desulfuromonadales bacterium]|nr:phosphoesterase [Desulfuromonadales bacterium]NIR34324.1 phosphoesterase [Desulfuromonadales bacterium]NIS41758.1 phosphoesterase [Desulfuromonadales bacterium]